MLCTKLKPNGKLSFNLLVQQSQVKKKIIGNVTVMQELFETKLVDYFIQGEGSSGKGLNVAYMVI